MNRTSFDFTPLQELLSFIGELFTIRYEEEELPENVGVVFDSIEEWSNREMRNVPIIALFRRPLLSSRLKDLKDIFWEEKFNNNNSFIENALLLINNQLTEAKTTPFQYRSYKEGECLTDEEVEELRELAIEKLNELNEFVKSLLTIPIGKTTNNNAINPVDVSDEPDFDNSISVEPNSDTRKVLFLWQFGIINHLHKMGYLNNEIGRIIMDLFELPENKGKNRRINIGSLINKIQNKNNPSDSPLNSDAGADYIEELEKKYKIQGRKKQ